MSEATESELAIQVEGDIVAVRFMVREFAVRMGFGGELARKHFIATAMQRPPREQPSTASPRKG